MSCSLEKGIILFLIEHSKASNEEKLQALNHLEKYVDERIDGKTMLAHLRALKKSMGG